MDAAWEVTKLAAEVFSMGLIWGAMIAATVVILVVIGGLIIETVATEDK